MLYFEKEKNQKILKKDSLVDCYKLIIKYIANIYSMHLVIGGNNVIDLEFRNLPELNQFLPSIADIEGLQNKIEKEKNEADSKPATDDDESANKYNVKDPNSITVSNIVDYKKNSRYRKY